MLKEKTKTKKTHLGKVTNIEFAARDLYLISFTSNDITNIQPGQFVSILCDNLTLRRPFSVAGFCKETKEISVYFKLKGEGTRYISSLRIGDNIDFIGPLGNGFHFEDEEDKKSLLIGAGVGFAPILYLKQFLPKATLVGAFTSSADIPSPFGRGWNPLARNELRDSGEGFINYNEFDEIVTNDGSQGKKGTIIDHLNDYINTYKPEKIYACGPEIVLKAVAEAGKKSGIETEVAMEKIMACSLGVCRGCVIQIAEQGMPKNATICHDGPVFKGGEVIWR